MKERERDRDLHDKQSDKSHAKGTGNLEMNLNIYTMYMDEIDEWQVIIYRWPWDMIMLRDDDHYLHVSIYYTPVTMYKSTQFSSLQYLYK